MPNVRVRRTGLHRPPRLGGVTRAVPPRPTPPTPPSRRLTGRLARSDRQLPSRAEVSGQQCHHQARPGRRTQPGHLLVEPRHLMPVQTHLYLHPRLHRPTTRPDRHTSSHRNGNWCEATHQAVKVGSSRFHQQLGVRHLARAGCPPEPFQQSHRQVHRHVPHPPRIGVRAGLGSVRTLRIEVTVRRGLRPLPRPSPALTVGDYCQPSLDRCRQGRDGLDRPSRQDVS